MRFVAIGDIGVAEGMIHLGDEAMFDALVEHLRARGVTGVTAISAAPSETAERYAVDAVSRIGFRGDRAAMQQRLDAVLAALGGRDALPADDPFRAVEAAVAESDAVLIAGGGNLASTWPTHIFERAALARIAEHHARPLVVTGQTLGPQLSPDDRVLVSGLLDSARLVGVREPASQLLAGELGTEAVLNRDDATFLGFPSAPPAPGTDIVVSLSTHLGGAPRAGVVAGLAHALDRLADETGLGVLFHPHWASLDPSIIAGDQLLHEEVRAGMRHPARSVGPGDARSAAALARAAAMLVTSRYHPAVFAAPAGVPIAALPVDDYTAVKLRGATGWWGQSGLVELATAAGAQGAAALLTVWQRGDESRDRAAELLEPARAQSAAWWDRVVSVASGQSD